MRLAQGGLIARRDSLFGSCAVCKDTERNTFGIMQDDPTAK
ncbi:MAG: hypothetical protein H6P98_1809 [Candidatus Aminicenantes bacterium]|nr:hypothetical protein [Candidatus Aminicenantes bacterium]